MKYLLSLRENFRRLLYDYLCSMVPCWAVKKQHIYKIRVVEIRVEMHGKIRFKMRKSA